MRRLKIFISYARVDKAFASQFAELLQRHVIWYDHRMRAGDNWWIEIEQRLKWCEVFIYLLTPGSVMSQFCQRELQIARHLGKKIIPVLMDKETRIPSDLHKIHYVDCSESISAPAIMQIYNALEDYALNQPIETRVVNVRPISEPTVSPLDELTQGDGSELVTRFAALMGQNNFEEALIIARRLKEINYSSRYVNPDALIVEAEAELERVVSLREREADYRAIAELVKQPRTRHLGCQSFQMFRRDYPNYDPQNLAQYCVAQSKAQMLPSQTPSQMPAQPATQQIAAQYGNADPTPAVMPSDRYIPVGTPSDERPSNPRKPSAQFQSPSLAPRLEWCHVPATVLAPAFLIAKYPVTNEQFAAFIKHPKGYANPEWWNFSPMAKAWRDKHPVPLQGRFAGDLNPRESLTWFDMVAYTRWLSKYMGEIISLPTLAHWRRAAQGNDHRLYPWGNEFNPSFCNYKESRINRTTEVTRYPDGCSNVGAFDMGGNVWEVMLDGEGAKGSYQQMLQVDTPRWMIGGSFASTADKLRITYQHAIEQTQYQYSIGFRLMMLTK